MIPIQVRGAISGEREIRDSVGNQAHFATEAIYWNR